MLRSVGNNIEFILSHPNGWEGQQQSEMRRAAINADLVNANEAPERISFVTEGEASLHFCLNKIPDTFKKYVGQFYYGIPCLLTSSSPVTEYWSLTVEEELWTSVHMHDRSQQAGKKQRRGASSKKSLRLSVPVHPFFLSAMLTFPQVFYRARILSPAERKPF